MNEMTSLSAFLVLLTQISHSVPLHCLHKLHSAHNVILVVPQRLGDTLANSLERSKMQNMLEWAILFEGGVKCLAIQHIQLRREDV